MKVRELITYLECCNPEADIKLMVYGHSYHSVEERRSHGAMMVVDDRTGTVILSTVSEHTETYYTNRAARIFKDT